MAALLFVFLAAPGASAERMTVVGQQFVTAGLALTPGFFYDATAPEVGLATVTAKGGGMARVGLQHWVASSFVMAAEAELGPQWFDDHTAHLAGRAEHEWALGWQLGLIGRWIPAGERGNFTAGLGFHIYRAQLADVPLQTVAADLRVGTYVWREWKFALVELGYSAPFLQGLDTPTDFTGEGLAAAPQNWTLHHFTLGFSYGF